jgi:hypothetical protein
MPAYDEKILKKLTLYRYTVEQNMKEYTRDSKTVDHAPQGAQLVLWGGMR